MRSNKSNFNNCSIRAAVGAALILLILNIELNANGKFEVRGKAVGLNGKTIVLLGVGVSESRTSDTLGVTIVKNGKFTFKGTIATPIHTRLIVSQSNQYSSFWIVPATVEVELDTAITSKGFPNDLIPVVKGSSEHDVYSLYLEQLKILGADLNREYEIMRAMKDPEEKKKQEEKVSDIREKYTESSNKFTRDFAKEHNNSFAACSILAFSINDAYGPIEQLVEIMNNFSAEVKLSLAYKKNSEQLASLLRIQPGKPAPDFTLKDTDEKDFSLSSLKGKVVLIDFWASWCVPCVASIPSMKDIYNKYKDRGFDILGVSNDSNIDAWKKCIQQNSIPWINVVDRFPKYGPAEIATLYSIRYLPTTLLINKDGIIIAKNLHNKQLEEKINEHLK